MDLLSRLSHWLHYFICIHMHAYTMIANSTVDTDCCLEIIIIMLYLCIIQ